MSTEVKIVFTADLKPYVEGLKSMLSMTATTGQQLKPLLNVDVKAPDVSGLESQLKAVVDQTEEYIRSLNDAGVANDKLGSKEEDHAAHTDHAAGAVERKSGSLNKAKRNALEAFGALSFLATGIVELSSKASGGSKDMDKLNRGMSEGISAGFGLAGTLSVLGIATGGWAVAIGAAVAIGLSLLRFFDDSEERLKRNATAMQLFSESLRGASGRDLEEYRKGLLQAIAASDQFIQAAERKKAALSVGDLAGRAETQSLISQEQARRALLVQEREKLDQELNARAKTGAEVREFIRQAETAATVDQFEQQRRAAEDTYKKEQEEFRGHADGLEAARKKHAAEMRRIAEEEAHFDKQIADQKFEAELARITADGVSRGALQEQLDLAILSARADYYRKELNALAALDTQMSSQQRLRKQQLETLLTQIQQQESQKRIDLERSERNSRMQLYGLLVREQIAIARGNGIINKQIEEQTAEDVLEVRRRAAQAELDQLKREESAAASAGRQLDQDKLLRKRELEVSLTEISVEGLEARKRTIQAERDAWEQHHQYILGPLLAGYDEFFNSIVNQSRTVTQQMIDDMTRQNEFSARQRQVDYDLFLIDQDARKKTLQAQLQHGEISQREYSLRIQQMELEKQQREQELRNASIQEEERRLELQEQMDEERKSSFERAYDAMRGTLIQAIGDMLREELRQGAISVAMHIKNQLLKTKSTVAAEAQQTAATEAGVLARLALLAVEVVKSLAAAAASMVKAAASVVEWEVATFGPFALVTIPATIAALVGIFNSIKSAFGFEHGGKIKKGQTGFFEGRDVEIIAPEKDFKEVFRDDLMPELLGMLATGTAHQMLLPTIRPEVLVEARREISGGRGSGIDLQFVERFEQAIDRLERLEIKGELVGDARTLKAVLRTQDEFDGQVGLAT
jgi:hypothetical protein